MKVWPARCWQVLVNQAKCELLVSICQPIHSVSLGRHLLSFVLRISPPKSFVSQLCQKGNLGGVLWQCYHCIWYIDKMSWWHCSICKKRTLVTCITVWVWGLGNQEDARLRWLTVQEDTQNYQSYQWCHGGAISHAKSSHSFLCDFLQTYETKSGMESLVLQDPPPTLQTSRSIAVYMQAGLVPCRENLFPFVVRLHWSVKWEGRVCIYIWGSRVIVAFVSTFSHLHGNLIREQAVKLEQR